MCDDAMLALFILSFLGFSCMVSSSLVWAAAAAGGAGGAAGGAGAGAGVEKPQHQDQSLNPDPPPLLNRPCGHACQCQSQSQCRINLIEYLITKCLIY
jgi:hypothetical protein